MNYYFYDTSSLLLRYSDLFTNPNEQIVISSITLQELENIKNSNKDNSIKFAARKLLYLLDTHKDLYETHIFKSDMMKPIVDKKLDIGNDTKILATAINYDNTVHPDEVVFVTNDLALKTIANLFFGNGNIISIDESLEDGYAGYRKVWLDDIQLSNFYSNLDNNQFDLYINQYLLIYDCADRLVDRLCWTGQTHRPIQFKEFSSLQFGKIKPIKDDVYQILAMDSFANNQITMIKGPAGSGKSYLSLGYLFSLLDKGKIDKIIIFCNTIATKDSAKLGYYPGDRNQKLLDSQIGTFLSSKLGDILEVEKMINLGKIVLIPLSDARGYDTTGMRAGIYVTEAQNMSVELMKLTLQRIGEDSVCIIDGDETTQVDDINFAGANNGMKRLSQVFRGSNLYGEIKLNKIHRSRIASLANFM